MTKKSEFTGRANYSVAMSQETGCIVMLKTLGGQNTVVGSLTREQSLGLSQGVIDFKEPPEIEEAVKKAIPKLSVVN